MASHGTAALLRELPGRQELPVEITCRRWRRTQQATLQVHETLELDQAATVVDGIP
jgi:hypothetical protein